MTVGFKTLAKRATRRSGLALAVGLLCLATLNGCLFGPSSTRAGSAQGAGVRPVRADAEARDAFELVNYERTRRGMVPLVRRQDLDAVALGHASDMLSMNRLSHVSSDGRSLEHRVAKLDWTCAGENLARNKGYDFPAREAVRGWIESPQHYENMFRPDFSDTGVAALHDPSTEFTYFVQVFIIPVD